MALAEFKKSVCFTIHISLRLVSNVIAVAASCTGDCSVGCPSDLEEDGTVRAEEDRIKEGLHFSRAEEFTSIPQDCSEAVTAMLPLLPLYFSEFITPEKNACWFILEKSHSSAS